MGEFHPFFKEYVGHTLPCKLGYLGEELERMALLNTELKSLAEKLIAPDESSLMLFHFAHGGFVSSNNCL